MIEGGLVEEEPVEEEYEKEWCCIGWIEGYALVRFFDIPGNDREVSFVCNFTLKTSTSCFDIKCKGITWDFPYYYSCDNEVEEWNNDQDTGTWVTGDGYNPLDLGNLGSVVDPAKVRWTFMTKLGCCTAGAERSITRNYWEFGTIPKALVLGDSIGRTRGAYLVGGEMMWEKYGLGGEIPPQFPPCHGCEEDKGDSGDSGGSKG